MLDAVSAKFKTYKAVQAKFLLKIENAAGKALGTKTGTVYMKGTKYRVSVTGQEIYCDGSNIWTYDKAAKEVTINKIDPSANSITPQKLFTNFYDKDFLYKLNGKTVMNGKSLQEVELTPIDKTKAFHKVLVFIDKSVINTTKVFEKTGNFDISLKIGEDTDLWVRIALQFPVAFTTSKSARYNMTAQNKISFSETTKREFARLDKFQKEEQTNLSLKKFLDLYRVVYALKHKLAGDSQNFEFYYAAIDLKNCSLKSRILLNSPRFVLQNLMKLSKTFNSNMIYFEWYTRLFKS